MTAPGVTESFDTDGFCLFPDLIPPELVERVIPRMDAVVNGDYATGTKPHMIHFGPDDPPDKLRKIDQPHLCDPVILELVSHPAIGRAVAGLLDASLVQVWATQLLVKPPTTTDVGNIGWHQDMQHWRKWWKGEVGTVWVALSDVTQESGPMRFVRGSYAWGLNENPSFFGDPDHSAQRKSIPKPPGATWEEVPALLQPGSASFHHRFTYHGSGPNRCAKPRRSFALHLRTERADVVGSSVYTDHLDDEAICPVLHRA